MSYVAERAGSLETTVDSAVKHGRPWRVLRRVAATLAIGMLAVLGVAVALGVVLGLRVNTSASVPVGLYASHRLKDQAIVRGELVVTCATQAIIHEGVRRGFLRPGLCPGGGAPLLKRVAGVAGDDVMVDTRGVSINSVLLPHSRPWGGRSARDLPRAKSIRLASGNVWLSGQDDPRSYDSRYYGPVPASSVLAAATPLWTVTDPGGAAVFEQLVR